MKLFLLISGILFSLQLSATHLVGGEIYYDYLGNNQYKITLLIYRDCGPTNSNNTQFDNVAAIGIFNNGNLQTTLDVPIGPVTNMPITISNPCLVVPPNACIEEARYTHTVTLPPMPGGYDIVYQRCCRNPSTQNIQNPNSQGATYHTRIPENGLSVNNSARFLNYPPAVLCAANPFIFDHSAIDPDGDSLVYELCTPFNGATSGNPAPNPPNSPPFAQVIWTTGYNTLNQIPGSPGLAIDAISGELTGTPTLQGIYTFGVCVKEYRNGTLLNISRRDFQFWVTNCDPVLIAGIPSQTDSCGGYTVHFGNNSVGSSFYLWDFGDGTTSTDPNPVHTFPNIGTFTIMLVANPGWPCADTVYSNYSINEPTSVSFQNPGPECFPTNSFAFNATGNFSSGSLFFWDFGQSANPPTSSDQNPTGIVYGDTGIFPIYMYVNDDGCIGEYRDTVEVFPVPVVNFGYPDQVGCEPYTVEFSDSSLSWEPLSYIWYFGDGDLSTEQNPVHIYNEVGIYDVTLIIQSDSICVSSDTMFLSDLIEVLPSPKSSFRVSPDITDVFRPYFTLTDLSSSDVIWMFYIDATGDTIFQNHSGQHVVNDTGYFGITQWVFNTHGCPDTSVEYVYIEPITTVYIPNAFTPDNDGENDIWLPVVRDVYDYELRVFNRWGEVIFTSHNQYQGWDGFHNGKQSPSDVYLYQVRFRNMRKLQEQKTGHFTLIR